MGLCSGVTLSQSKIMDQDILFNQKGQKGKCRLWQTMTVT